MIREIAISGLITLLTVSSTLPARAATDLDQVIRQLNALIAAEESFNRLKRSTEDRCTIFYKAYPIPRASEDLYYVARFRLPDIQEITPSKSDLNSLYLRTARTRNTIFTDQYRISTGTSTNQPHYRDVLHFQFHNKADRDQAVSTFRKALSYCPRPPLPKPDPSDEAYDKND